VETIESLTARQLVQRFGGRVVEFRRLPATAKQAILARAAEHLDPDTKSPRIDPKQRFGYVEIPMEALQQAVLAAVQREGAPFKTFEDYHRWYISHGIPSHIEVWPIELDMDDPDQIIDDGSHRFHSYVRSGVKVVPAIYRPS